MNMRDKVPQSPVAKHALEFTFPAMKIGVGEYKEGPTGCTAFLFNSSVSCAVDVRGGSSCTVLLDGWETGDAQVDGICFAGGSVCGIEAIGGVATTLFSRRPGAEAWEKLPRVMGAIIYDFRPRQNSIFPDKALGQFAVEHAREGWFPLGPHGAGCSASCGKGPEFNLWEVTGQGAAFAKLPNTSVLVFTVVNSIGAIVDRSGQTVRGHFDRKSGKHHSFESVVSAADLKGSIPKESNTTLTLLVTDQKLRPFVLRQLARQVHSSMARAINPFHTIRDGDVFFAVSTQETDCSAQETDMMFARASELAWDAVLNSFESS